VKERWSYRCTEWWIRRGRSDMIIDLARPGVT